MQLCKAESAKSLDSGKNKEEFFGVLQKRPVYFSIRCLCELHQISPNIALTKKKGFRPQMYTSGCFPKVKNVKPVRVILFYKEVHAEIAK